MAYPVARVAERPRGRCKGYGVWDMGTQRSGLRNGVIAIAILLFGIGGVAVWRGLSPDADPTLVDATPDANGTGNAAVTAGVVEATSDSGEETGTEIASAPETPPDAADPDAMTISPPSLDLVRVDDGGAAVVAGRADGAGDVVIRLDGVTVSTTQADASGNFVSLFDLEVTETPRILTVETQQADGTVTRAEGSIIVAAPKPVDQAADTPPAVAAATAARDTASEARLDDAEGAGSTDATTAEAEVVAEAPGADAETSDAPAPEAQQDVAGVAAPPAGTSSAPEPVAINTASAPVEAPSAPRLFRVDPDGVTVLSNDERAPDVRERLGIDAISYDGAGEVQVSGRAARDSNIRIYVDDEPVQLVEVDETGAWQSPLPNVDVGTYTLRIDALDAAGDVESRVETPFRRSDPDVVAAVQENGVTAITVQPGSTLWAISEQHLGAGTRFVQIFEENKSLIRDPDLIFPGQVFALPEGN